MLDKRYSIETLDGQKKALSKIFTEFMNGDLDMTKVKGAVQLIREARQVIQTEQTMKIGNDAISSLNPSSLTPEGPFPRLIKRK